MVAPCASSAYSGYLSPGSGPNLWSRKISAMAVRAFSGLRSSWAISRSWAAGSRDRRRLFSAGLRPVFIMAYVLDLRREMVVQGDYKMVNAILAAAVSPPLTAGHARAVRAPPAH